ncbi:MAG: hypothetical protein KVP17_004624 [Porospora cf. gigantea B]|uniref:uncharacterized protein n=1 Tax=Porospora cf. gigantea B TaxID=2853592 RepID=UPI003571A1CE|nr:MAG: hypothetical protein KVP17_004624 [Porospora cf. gigantea B]
MPAYELGVSADSLQLSDSAFSQELSTTPMTHERSRHAILSPGIARALPKEIRPILRLPQGGIVDMACETSRDDHSPLSSPFLDSPVTGTARSNQEWVVPSRKGDVQLSPVDLECAQFSQLESALSLSQRQLDESRVEVNSLTSQVIACREENSRLTRDLHVTQLELDIIRNELKGQENLLQSEHEQISYLKQQLHSAERKRGKAELANVITSNIDVVETNKLQSELRGLESAFERANLIIERLKEENATLREEYQESCASRDELRLRISTMEDQATELADSRKEVKKLLKALEERNEELRSVKRESRVQLERTAEAIRDRLQQSLDRKVEAFRRKHESKVASLRREHARRLLKDEPETPVRHRRDDRSRKRSQSVDQRVNYREMSHSELVDMRKQLQETLGEVNRHLHF